MGKRIKFTHKKIKQIATFKPLELVHIDLIGHTQIESIGGKKFIFVSVDDFSRFTWVNFIQEKSDTFSMFRALYLKVQVENGTKIECIRRIRTDHGRKFKNSEFANFCDEQGIRHEFSTSKTPQQNGVVKIKNR